MARQPTGNPDGRPPKEFNWKTFEELCFIHCTQSEICSVLELNHETLEKKINEKYGETYSQSYKRFSEGGKKSLTRMQFKQAEKNCSMAIWLGKQWLGQRDEEKEDKLQELNQIVNLQKQNFELQAKLLASQNALQIAPSPPPASPDKSVLTDQVQ